MEVSNQTSALPSAAPSKYTTMVTSGRLSIAVGCTILGLGLASTLAMGFRVDGFEPGLYAIAVVSTTFATGLYTTIRGILEVLGK